MELLFASITLDKAVFTAEWRLVFFKQRCIPLPTVVQVATKPKTVAATRFVTVLALEKTRTVGAS
jgi:hypothetical protein